MSRHGARERTNERTRTRTHAHTDVSQQLTCDGESTLENLFARCVVDDAHVHPAVLDLGLDKVQRTVSLKNSLFSHRVEVVFAKPTEMRRGNSRAGTNIRR